MGKLVKPDRRILQPLRNFQAELEEDDVQDQLQKARPEQEAIIQFLDARDVAIRIPDFLPRDRDTYERRRRRP